MYFIWLLSSGGKDQAESDEAQAGDCTDRREDRRGGAHAAAGQAQGEVQHDAGHARHQHPRAHCRTLRLAALTDWVKPEPVLV